METWISNPFLEKVVFDSLNTGLIIAACYPKSNQFLLALSNEALAVWGMNMCVAFLLHFGGLEIWYDLLVNRPFYMFYL